MKYIVGHENWCKAYTDDTNRDRIWIYILTSDGKELHLKEYDQWLTFQEHIDKNNLTIKKVGLRYRSHCITMDAKDSRAVYIVRSVKGEMHNVTKQCYTLGFLRNNDEVEKTMWLTPALIEELKTVDKLKDCFKEAFVYHDRQGETV